MQAIISYAEYQEFLADNRKTGICRFCGEIQSTLGPEPEMCELCGRYAVWPIDNALQNGQFEID